MLNSIYDIYFQLLWTFNWLIEVGLPVAFRLTSSIPVLKQYFYINSPSDYFSLTPSVQKQITKKHKMNIIAFSATDAI